MNEFGWQPPVLTTARLVVRPFIAADIPELFRLASNPNVARYTLWSAHRSRDDSHNFIHSYAQSQYLAQVPEPMAIALVENTAALVGSIGCFWSAREHKSMELGYWVAEEYWGRGYAVEAATVLLDHVFAEFDVVRMQAHCVVANEPSARVIRKLGFQFEGVARSAAWLRGTCYDVERYAILKSEWKN